MTNKIKELTNFIRKIEAKEAAEKRRTKIEHQNHLKKGKKAFELEEKLKDKKIRIANDIFKWAREFSQTGHYNRLVKISMPYIALEKGVYVYGGGWGHKTPKYDDDGCWSRVYLEPNGSLYYVGGYKWFPSDSRFRIHNPDSLAERLNYDYLSGFRNEIKSGKIYGTIKDWIKNDE